MTKVKDIYGRLPLHYACWKNAPSDFIIESINDYPQACKEKDNRIN